MGWSGLPCGDEWYSNNGGGDGRTADVRGCRLWIVDCGLWWWWMVRILSNPASVKDFELDQLRLSRPGERMRN